MDYCASKFPSLPVIPNERAGLWYTRPGLNNCNQSAYFKSTDGHFGVWNFSLKRLNLHILPTIADNGGCLLIDTTKRGKRFPDSLGKTVPIWCSVLNAAVYGILTHPLHSTNIVMSDSEREQINELVPSFLEKLHVNIIYRIQKWTYLQ